MLVRIVKNWTFPDLLRQTPNCDGAWGDINFTLEPVTECDALLVLNELKEDITVCCPPENIWSIFQEPYYPAFLPWLKEGHSRFSRIYTPHPPNSNVRYRYSHPLVPWHVGKSYAELLIGSNQPKNNDIIWITSSLQVLPGHFKRNAFRSFLVNLAWSDLIVRGRGISPVEDKWDLLTPSRYAIAVENYFGDNYWTEKIADCWLAGVLPFYYGCPNLEEYFPAKSFIRIDLDDLGSAARIIRQMVDSGEYEKRLPAILEARDLVLNRYQFFPFMAHELRDSLKNNASLPVQLKSFCHGHLSALRNNCMQRYQQYKARISVN